MAASTMRKTGRPRAFILKAAQCNDEDKFGQHQHLGKNTVRAHHHSGGKGHEITGDMRQEKALQTEKSRSVDESGIETEQLKLTAGLHRLAPQVLSTMRVSLQ
jgi:hypothetical protein